MNLSGFQETYLLMIFDLISYLLLVVIYYSRKDLFTAHFRKKLISRKEHGISGRVALDRTRPQSRENSGLKNSVGLTEVLNGYDL
jgi:hypothetical protein